MKLTKWIDRFNLPVRFTGEEEKIKGNILFIGTIACFLGLTVLIIVHVFDPLFSLISPAFFCALAMLLTLVLVYFKQLVPASYLLLLSLLSLIFYQLAFQVNGIHETAILLMPGLLILAGLLLKKWEYLVFTIIVIIGVTAVILREMAGYHKTPFTENEPNYFSVDILVILAGTAISVGILVRSYMRNLLKTKDSEKRLRELNATKDKFFSIISHDLRSPFNNILGLSELLHKEARTMDIDAVVQYAGTLNSSAQLTFQLLENLLYWARIQQGNMPFSPTEVSACRMIDLELAGLMHNADLKNIRLLNRLHRDLEFRADEYMVRSILRNLISNSIKFTPRNGQVEINAKRAGIQVIFSVTDNGVGMNAETLAGLFRIDTATSAPGTEREKGTGLGLILCREFVEKHGGHIQAVSKPGKGSTFSFSIPADIQ